MTEPKEDLIDKIVTWGCKTLHLDKHAAFFRQLAKFVIVGVVSTAINWFIFAICLSSLAIPDEVLKSAIASAIAFVLSTIFNFWASVNWVFDTTSKKTRRRLFLEFAIFTFISFLIFDEAMLAWLVSSSWHPMIAKVATTAFGMVFNFITRKLFLEDNNKLKQKLHLQPKTASKGKS